MRSNVPSGNQLQCEGVKAGMQHSAPRALVAVSAAFVLVAAACSADTSETVHVPAGEATSRVERIAAVANEAEVGARAVNDFGLDLLRLNTGLHQGNVALSPWSIATALAMTRGG